MMHSLNHSHRINKSRRRLLMSRLMGDSLPVKKFQWLCSLGITLSAVSGIASAQEAAETTDVPLTFSALQTRCTPEFAELEPPALPPRTFDINDVVEGNVDFEQLQQRGSLLFTTAFTLCDGYGRPATTGGGEFVGIDDERPIAVRTTGPDANACADCHSNPTVGGAGRHVQGAFAGFLGGRTEDGDTINTGAEAFRNPPALNGACIKELMGNEMTEEIQQQANDLIARGVEGHQIVTSKNVKFEIEIKGKEIVASRGINPNLEVSPFTLAGVVRSIRQFDVDAYSVHFGLQASEAFDNNPARGIDFDQDGIPHELIPVDLHSVVHFICSLPIPQQVIPPGQESAIAEGEEIFNRIGCNTCHINELTLNNPNFTEPNIRNEPPVSNDQSIAVTFNAVLEGQAPRLPINPDGSVTVRAFTDYKRHNLCDPEDAPDPIRHFCNETFLQGRQAEQDGRPGAEFFLTKALWDVGSTEPYGHTGTLTTITQAIYAHGGEARHERDKFLALATKEKQLMLAFLKSLVILIGEDANINTADTGSGEAELEEEEEVVVATDNEQEEEISVATDNENLAPKKPTSIFGEARESARKRREESIRSIRRRREESIRSISRFRRDNRIQNRR